MVNPHFKPQLDGRNCRYYERFGMTCKKGHKLPCKATICKDYRGNGSGSGN